MYTVMRNVQFHILGPFAKLQKSDYWRRHICLSVCLCVRVEQLGPTGQIFMKYDIREFFEKSVKDSPLAGYN
jgi:hypothetical protein